MIAAHVWHGGPTTAAALAVAARGLAVAAGALSPLLGDEWSAACLRAMGGRGSGSGGDSSSDAIGPSILPADAVVHITVAWAVGGLMSYLSDWYRR
jgi:hypothetical protein